MEAIVLAGGMGTRLRSVVSDRPKVLADIAGKPFLDYLLEYLIHYGVAKVILSVCYKKEQIQERYKNGFNKLIIDYCEEKEPLGTGGAIQKSLLQCEAETVFVLNGDSILLMSLKKMMGFHHRNGAVVTLAVRQVSDGSRYGSVLFDNDGRIQGFAEKKHTGPIYINGGIYCMDREKVEKICGKMRPPFSIEHDIFPNMIRKNCDILALPTDSFFIDIGIPESLRSAQVTLPGQFPIRDWAGIVV